MGCQPCWTPHAGAPSSIPSPTVPPIHPQHSPSLLPQFPSAELRPPHHSPSPAYPPRGFSGGCCGVLLVAGPPPTPNLGSFCLYGLLIELCCGLPPPQATSSAFMPVMAFSCAGWAGVSRAVPRLHHPQHSFYFNFFFLINLFTHFGAFPLWVFFSWLVFRVSPPPFFFFWWFLHLFLCRPRPWPQARSRFSKDNKGQACAPGTLPCRESRGN